MNKFPAQEPLDGNQLTTWPIAVNADGMNDETSSSSRRVEMSPHVAHSGSAKLLISWLKFRSG